MAPRAKLPWLTLGILGCVGLVAGGFFSWLVSVRTIDQGVDEKRATLKHLRVGGHPPDLELMEYLETWPPLVNRYQSILALVTARPALIEGSDPQLYFQQRVHEVQRVLERLATARGMSVPEQLGLPKELPPPHVVSRLLVQLELMEDAAELILAQGVKELASFKIEDSRPVPDQLGEETLVVEVPIQVQFVCSLESLVKVLGGMQHASPLIDVLRVRLGTSEDPAILEVELKLARYLLAPSIEPPPDVLSGV